MGISRRNMAGIVAMVTWLACLGFLWKDSAGAESSRIVDGSNVTYFYRITVPGESKFEVRKIGQFVQGRHQLPPTVERAVTGMKTGDEKKVDLSAGEAFGHYDTKKKKTVPTSDLPAGTKEGDVLTDHAGREATVIQLSDRFAVMDYNHPLAGKPLRMKITILRVDDPS
ncbi:MAG TPA: FKBP-type peptidyl-prolyl cis-trans isomerase [Nitrospiraceae bacterium]|nr:FKBP-type peptidyl-prolyl cis-trans isomerase [Nitrospiraceae bacterium]